MLICSPRQVIHGDVIGFKRGESYIIGMVVEIVPYPHPGEVGTMLWFALRVESADHGEVTALVRPNEEVDLLYMHDDQNPARTRNHRPHWPFIGIREV